MNDGGVSGGASAASVSSVDASGRSASELARPSRTKGRMSSFDGTLDMACALENGRGGRGGGAQMDNVGAHPAALPPGATAAARAPPVRSQGTLACPKAERTAKL